MKYRIYVFYDSHVVFIRIYAIFVVKAAPKMISGSLLEKRLKSIFSSFQFKSIQGCLEEIARW